MFLVTQIISISVTRAAQFYINNTIKAIVMKYLNCHSAYINCNYISITKLCHHLLSRQTSGCELRSLFHNSWPPPALLHLLALGLSFSSYNCNMLSCYIVFLVHWLSRRVDKFSSQTCLIFVVYPGCFPSIKQANIVSLEWTIIVSHCILLLI